MRNVRGTRHSLVNARTLAFCCDDWAEDTVPPGWLRFAEAAGCASVTGLGAIIMYFGDLLPFPANMWPHHWMLVAWIVLPTVMALFVGGCVPHIYRSARRAATARHEEAREPPAPAPSLVQASIPPRTVAGIGRAAHLTLAAKRRPELTTSSARIQRGVSGSDSCRTAG